MQTIDGRSSTTHYIAGAARITERLRNVGPLSVSVDGLGRPHTFSNTNLKAGKVIYVTRYVIDKPRPANPGLATCVHISKKQRHVRACADDRHHHHTYIDGNRAQKVRAEAALALAMSLFTDFSHADFDEFVEEMACMRLKKGKREEREADRLPMHAPY